MGVELSVPKVGSPADMLPEWLHLSLAVPEDDQKQVIVAEECPSTGPPDLMSRCLAVPGVLHIVDNLAHDINARLSYWKQFWEHLKALEELLTSQHLLDRFIHTCLSRSAHFEREEDFRRIACPRLYETRWGVVVAFLHCLLPRLTILEETFDAEVFDPSPKKALMVLGIQKALF